MDKTAIRNFAIEARKILMKSAITEAGFYGITKDGCKDPVQKGNDFEVYETVAGTENRIFGDDIKRRANLVQAIKTLGFEQVIEETAYTWFNRIIAIRFMEINNYLPTRVRVLSSETGSGTPDIITQADTVELNLTSDELEKIQTSKRENRYDDAFRMLFIKQCNELNAILPGLFEKTDDYMELLLKITYTGDGVIRMLVDSIPEDNFNVETEGQVEIIGWMYQYYNTELKDDTFAKLKKNVKITKERIPAATQLFTPDWIVRYMVENSLGRVWIEHLRAVNPAVDEKAKAEEFGWKYYLPEAEQEDDVKTQLVEIRKSYKDLTPQDITCIDPCMGSGHILVYMFDVLMDIYRSEGFSEREAVFDILEKNIRGLDIDRRAYQLSYFALMMKARGYNRIFFRGHEDIEGNRVQAVPRVYAIEESNSIDREQLGYFGAGLDELSKNNSLNQMNGLLDALHNAKEYGSILKIEKYDWELLRSFLNQVNEEGQSSLFGFMAYQSKAALLKLIDIGETLASRYDAVVTNPPYMGGSGMTDILSGFVKKNYPNSKSDLFACFIERCMFFVKKDGYCGMITQHAWMFLSTFEKLRKGIIGKTIINMSHLGARAFEEINGEVVQTVSWIMSIRQIDKYSGKYIRLTEYKDPIQKSQEFFKAANRYTCSNDKFLFIDGNPIVYWGTSSDYEAFKTGKTMAELAPPKQGSTLGNNEAFLRLWYEIKKNDKKWFKCLKGGLTRKWYGNHEFLVDWENDGQRVKAFGHQTIRNADRLFCPGISWSRMGGSAFRIMPEGFFFESASGVCYPSEKYCKYILGFLNSKIVERLSKMINPTLHFQSGDLERIPVIVDESCLMDIDTVVDENIAIAKADWDSVETSWDFEEHPFVAMKRFHSEEDPDVNTKIQNCYFWWEKTTNERFNKLKSNEEYLNKFFINLYHLQDELVSSVEDKDVVVKKADLQRDMRSFMSYAVGCMFGRYSLIEKGLVCDGNSLDENKYGGFDIDTDAIIPITDESYFSDDVVNRFEEFVKFIYGNDYIEENLDYIGNALGVKGTSSREKIRNYFLSDFYKDHCNAYSTNGSGKRPIYWLFDSGKENGFKCLIYLHRYNADTVGLIRSDYLTKTQTMIENALKNAEYAINSSASAVDKAQATKKRDKYIKQLAEIRSYYPALSHIALQRINLDLDDGVKANYEKFQNIEVSIEGEKKQKVNLLAKI